MYINIFIFTLDNSLVVKNTRFINEIVYFKIFNNIHYYKIKLL